LIVGDAFTTTKQESLLSVLSGRDDVKGPPAYLTTNWKEAKNSIKNLRNLLPVIALPSHGAMLKGNELIEHLDFLVNHFNEEAVPFNRQS
ncbi:MAG: metallo-beta-lactamase superfamily Zn-dependent hydrolase, partial [Herbinix sp.]|nr:metallo-beta-lactamase superfamily Zn-dependent hydrolase [Herbinix sp.]